LSLSSDRAPTPYIFRERYASLRSRVAALGNIHMIADNVVPRITARYLPDEELRKG